MHSTTHIWDRTFVDGSSLMVRTNERGEVLLTADAEVLDPVDARTLAAALTRAAYEAEQDGSKMGMSPAALMRLAIGDLSHALDVGEDTAAYVQDVEARLTLAYERLTGSPPFTVSGDRSF